MFNPVATYRLQFHKDFNFDKFQEIIDYLRQLGIKTIYASPVFDAVPGSMHGYDGIHPHRMNPEIGSEEQFVSIRKELQEKGIDWIQDIVPNHMAYHSDNELLMDVLEKGPHSVYADFFDIIQDSPVYGGSIMAPILGNTLEDVLKKGELQIAYKYGRLMLTYYENYFPLNPASYSTILASDNQPEVVDELLQQLPDTQDKQLLHNQWLAFIHLLERLRDDNDGAQYIAGRLETVNKDIKLITRLAESQYYRLCHWQETNKQINYRRFFTINGLICLNMQFSLVFDFFHLKVKELLDAGYIQGLRIDHIDGLYDPSAYLDQLRSLAGENVYITVEKILQPHETLPVRWPVQGTTGYDFLAQVNNLFTNRNAVHKLTSFYQELIEDDTSVAAHTAAMKKYMLYTHMQGELDNLYRLFVSSAFVPDAQLEGWGDQIKEAIAAMLVYCPVYRYYGNAIPLDKEEAVALKDIFQAIRKHSTGIEEGIALLESVLLDIPRTSSEYYRKKVLHFYMRCMQFASPLMAKGVEDTLMYTYNRFIGHNDVGDHPDAFGIAIEEFHQAMIEKQKNWSLSVNTTSTHDTKRGEDVRARLNVISDNPEEWTEAIQQWLEINKAIKRNNAPDLNDEYFIYQTIVGTYPMPGEENDDYLNRLLAYIQKALRESKRNSDWQNPNERYEKDVSDFIQRIFDEQHRFLQSFRDYYNRIVDHGIINSLVQLVLKCTCPGVPDIYQGTELWDLTFVDPDNRRAVDYQKRKAIVEEIVASEHEGLRSDLWRQRYNGTIKLWLTQKLLSLRSEHSELLAKGDYIPLKVTGRYKDNIIAFARVYKHQWLILIAPLHLAAIAKDNETTFESINWEDTQVIVPTDVPALWRDVLGCVESRRVTTIHIQDVFRQLPLSIIMAHQPENKRSAGVWLSVTSLPSAYAIGDMGPEAVRFVDFLSGSKQRYWQLLPLNPISASGCYSPYSSVSTMAGNTLLISPDKLAAKGLLQEEELTSYTIPPGRTVDYKKAETIKNIFFDIAYNRFCNPEFSSYQVEFQLFCEREAYWLEDFAVYTLLKGMHSDKPWYEWDESYKTYHRELLKELLDKHAESINKVKWLQFIFKEQWQELKEYCRSRDIKLLGDLPFYVSYDSVDVWANQDIFCLNENGGITGVAGVPPDYFSKSGQLWGMPTFNWDVLKKQDYDWWMIRLKKNLELFDLLRLDHFRAFAAYWQVDAGETTAINGRWISGPGADFFEVVQKELGSLPFVAEDLGDNMDEVYVLRDKVGLPGMKVLQFAFDENMPVSVDIPHNYKHHCIVYTGTHDNNTTKGWFRTDITKENKKQIERYAGVKVTETNINDVMARLAYASIADTVILPMQDILEADESSRMNTPGGVENNWLWQLSPEDLNPTIEEKLRNWCAIYNRC